MADVLRVEDGHWDGLSRLLADLSDDCAQTLVDADASGGVTRATPGAISAAAAQVATDRYLDRKRQLAAALQDRSETATRTARMFDEADDQAAQGFEQVSGLLPKSTQFGGAGLVFGTSGDSSAAWARVAERLGGGV
ncbi:MAG: hypothetical protein FWD63_08190 [Propionibacteriaceae bacterium]|nr:hypothetical protein [Propionibacteriaceae bacterium]